MKTDLTESDMYYAFDDLYDCIYEDAVEILYDDIYDEMFKDLYDAFYDGAVSGWVDSISYSEWYDTNSDTNERWYDTTDKIVGFK